MPQLVGVVAVLIAHRDLRDALAHLLHAIVLDAIGIPLVRDAGRTD